MADKIQNLKNWQNNEKLNARDYKHERDKIASTVNTIIDEQTAQDGKITALETEVGMSTSTSRIDDLETDKVSKSGDTMTGALTFASANQTRLILGDNDITMDNDATINATTFQTGDYTSDAVRYSDLANILNVSVGSGTPDYKATLTSNFTSAYTKTSELGQDFVLRDGTSTMTGNLDMGGQSITNVNLVDSVDVAQLKSDFDTVAAFFELGDADNAINKLQEIIDVFQGYEEGFDLAAELLTKMDVDGSNSALTGLTFDDEVTQATLTYDHDKKVLQVSNGATLTINGDLVFAGGKAVGAITIGDVVQFAGSQGSHYLVKKAVGSEIAEQPELILGIAHETVANNEFVRVSWFGEVRGLDLSLKQLGDILYFDVVNSELTTTRPTTDPIIQLAAVTNNTNNGSLLVRPKFISRKAQEIFVQAVANKFNAGDVQELLELLYDKIQTHEDDTTNPHAVTAAQVGAYTTSEADAAFAAASHTHTEANITDLDKYTQQEVNTFLSGKADLVNGLIPVSQIPFQFDDVLQGYIDQNVFYEEDTFVTVIPAAAGKLYIDISTNDIYRYDGSTYVLVKEAVGSLSEIPNVTLTNEQTGDLLRYNGSLWVNDLLPLQDLENVVITNVADGQYLKYDSATSTWVNVALDTPVIDSLDAIDDVNATSPNAGDILQYNASTSTWDLNRINFVSDTAPSSPNEGDLWFDSSSLVLYVYYNDGDSAQWVNAVSGIVEGQPEALNFTTVISTSDWAGSEPTTAVKTITGISIDDKPLIDINLSNVSFANIETTQAEYAKIYRVAATADDEITFYALEAPTENLTIEIQVVR